MFVFEMLFIELSGRETEGDRKRQTDRQVKDRQRQRSRDHVGTERETGAVSSKTVMSTTH